MYLLIGLYLVAIVIANLTIATFGASFAIVNAFTLISLDITTRDRLHAMWEGEHLKRNMVLLILAGSVLSAAFDYAAWKVATVSFVAFLLSQTADTYVYSRLRARGWFARVNGSNAVSALVDSAVFLTGLALIDGVPWAMLPALIAAQWGAKIAGGVLWAFVLQPRAALQEETV